MRTEAIHSQQLPAGYKELTPEVIDSLSLRFPINCTVMFLPQHEHSNQLHDFRGSCYKCGQYGHRHFQCNGNRNHSARTVNRCTECGKYGHLAEVCWNRKDHSFQNGKVEKVLWSSTEETLVYQVECDNNTKQRVLLFGHDLFFGINCPVQVMGGGDTVDAKVVSCEPLRRENGRTRMLYKVSYPSGDGSQSGGSLTDELLSYRPVKPTSAETQNGGSLVVSPLPKMTGDQSLKSEVSTVPPNLSDEATIKSSEVDSTDGKTIIANEKEGEIYMGCHTKGVTYHRQNGKYSSHIMHEKVTYYGGQHTLAADACRVYDEFINELKIPERQRHFATKNEYANARAKEIENRGLSLENVGNLGHAIKGAKSRIAWEFSKKRSPVTATAQSSAQSNPKHKTGRAVEGAQTYSIPKKPKNHDASPQGSKSCKRGREESYPETHSLQCKRTLAGKRFIWE